jgi:integrase
MPASMLRNLPLLRAIEVYQGTHVTRLAMKLMAMTFVRTSELIGAKWAEFDLEAARWNIPAERMKMRTRTLSLWPAGNRSAGHAAHVDRGK